MLAKRIISALIGIAVIVPTFVYLQGLSMILIYGVMIICLFEFFSMYAGKEQSEPPFVYLLNCFLFLMLLDYMQLGPAPTLFISLLIFLLSFLFFHPKLSTLPLHLGMNILACLYIILPLLHFLYFLRMPQGQYWMMLVLAATWIGDSGAYFFGRAFGKRKLFPRVSPGKTWEGLIGQVIGAFVGAFLWGKFLMPAAAPVSFVDCLAVGAIASTLGPLGDLCESMFKRAFGTKDSGSLMPGHGGLLDRIDGILLTGPAFFYYLNDFKGN